MHPLLAILLAGAAQIDITPTWFPLIINCGMLERTANSVSAPLYAKAIVLQQGNLKTAILVADSCMMPRELLDEAKAIAEKATGIPANRQLISATHTHFAPAAMSCLGSSVDERYAKWLPAKLAEAIIEANKRLTPARIGSAAIADREHTFVRSFIYRAGKELTDPFGNKTVRANMHPGHENPDVTLPTGPVDPTLTILSIQSEKGQPIAMLANYAMHYFNSKPISSDYPGVFAKQFEQRINAPKDFVTIMSQGTSGDLMYMDYSKPANKDLTIETYTSGIVDNALKAYNSIEYEKRPTLKMLETELSLTRRLPSPERLEWANKLLETMGTNKPKNQPEVYAREAVYLDKEPKRTLKLQALQIGTLAIASWPNEVYAISGLKLRTRTSFPKLMNIELANGAEGYIPPPEQHTLGGYTTWPARSAGLEVQAEPKILATLTGLLNQLGNKPKPTTQPKNYWPMEDLESNADLKIEGPHAFAVPGKTGHALYLANASLTLNKPLKTYKLSFWIWPAETRQWAQVTIEQTKATRRTTTNGQLTSETAPTPTLQLLNNFEGAIDEITLLP
ncbi:MAG: hypothetical protein NTW74_12920 [Acidobacteria bacterium]|nr:hypothetical protein [Acidobacteriota bacterium]